MYALGLEEVPRVTGRIEHLGAGVVKLLSRPLASFFLFLFYRLYKLGLFSIDPAQEMGNVFVL